MYGTSFYDLLLHCRMSSPATLIGWMKAIGVFLACLLACCLLPIVAVYGHAFVPLPDLLFFFPQLAFPYDNVVVNAASGQQTVFSHPAALTLSVLQWGLLAVGFGWLARRLRIRHMLLVAVLVIVAATLITHYGIKMFGATVTLDGL